MRLSDVDLRLLRVFKAVAEAGGIVKAQGVLGISQPTISAHIANLEKRLNVRLAERGPQGFALTAQGEEVLVETDRMLAYLDQYVSRLDEIGQASEQLVRLGLIDCMATDPHSPLRAAILASKAKCNAGSSSTGGMHIRPCTGRSSDLQSFTKSSASAGCTPAFCASWPVFT